MFDVAWRGHETYLTTTITITPPHPTPPHPSSGDLSITPSHGYVFETDFTFVSENWVDEDLPLTYKFVYTVGYEGSWTAVADAQASASYYDALLPQGESADNYTITGMSVVCDFYDAYGTATDTTRVLPVQYTTAQLANVSAARTTAALESGDPELSMQVMGATHKSLSGGSSGRRKLMSSSAEAAVRTTLLVTLKDTYSISDITEANVASMFSTLDGIVNAPNDLTTATAVGCLVFAEKLLDASVSNSIGISDDGTSYAGTAISWLLLSSMFNASDVTSTTSVSAANVTDALRALSMAQLDGAYAGVGYTVSAALVHSSSAREEAQYLGGDTKGVPGSSAKVVFPSNFSNAAKLGVTATTYLDTRVVTIDADVYTAYDGYGNKIASNMYGDSKYNTDLNSAVTQVEVMDEDGNVFGVSGLDPAAPILLTLEATEAIDTNFSAWKLEKICYTDGKQIEMDCPLGPQTYTCDSSLGGVDGSYFLDFTCPGVIPTCMWWSEAEDEWAHEGCDVVNYTSTNVTCACTHLTDFVLGKNVSAASVDVTYTSAPTAVPTPLPTTLPTPAPTTSLPTPIPYPMPTVMPGNPTKAPVPAPTAVPIPVPTPAPTAVPTPGSPLPTTLPTLAPTTSDTVAVSATMTMDGLDASAVTDDDMTAIKNGLAKVLDGVNASHISGVSVADASTRRRGRSLLGTAATVSFTVQVSLAETTFTSLSALESTVSSMLSSMESDSSTLIAKIKATASSSAKWDDVTGVSGTATAVLTRSPSAVPSFAPSVPPSLAPSLGAESDNSANTADTSGILVGALLAAVALAGLGLGGAWKHRRNRQQKGSDRLRVKKKEDLQSAEPHFDAIAYPPVDYDAIVIQSSVTLLGASEEEVPDDSSNRRAAPGDDAAGGAGDFDLALDRHFAPSKRGSIVMVSAPPPPPDEDEEEDEDEDEGEPGSIDLVSPGGHQRSRSAPPMTDSVDYETSLCSNNSTRETESSGLPPVEVSEDSLAAAHQAVEFQL